MINCNRCGVIIQGCSSKPYRQDFRHTDENDQPTNVCPACHGGK